MSARCCTIRKYRDLVGFLVQQKYKSQTITREVENTNVVFI